MRTVAKHQAVGYELPQHREACRHCKHLGSNDEERHGYAMRFSCKVHAIDVQLGGVCPVFVWKSAPYKRAPQPGEVLQPVPAKRKPKR